MVEKELILAFDLRYKHSYIKHPIACTKLIYTNTVCKMMSTIMVVNKKILARIYLGN